MKRFVITWIVAGGIVFAGAVQSTLHHHAAAVQLSR